ncbi:hypothetical protein TSUD_410000 [Trifolium subterraneum]|uniref:Uncharacterized protein n=1 Tax=Trifolium subterraneum TaxID=3900 RepID=A0A2Z6P472_TRISU|nr:hypothetical protein TSUD_410000 [Trifolium subterraneum]
MESFQNEKQIMVDPHSLRNSPIKQVYNQETKKLPTIITTPPPILLHPPILQPPKLRFLSLSLPNSVNSSPRFDSVKKPKFGSPDRESTTNVSTTLQELLQEAHFGKSKSCGDGRESASLEEFDFDQWLTKLSTKELEKWEWHYGTFTKTEQEHVIKESQSPKNVFKQMKITSSHDGFKCNALCLFLPNFVGKIKPIKTRKEVTGKVGATMSRNVSLENFECGSWASAAMSHEIDGDTDNSYFDLPLELMKYGVAIELDSHSPISAASFGYEKEIKGVLKNGSARGSVRKLDASPRHVRFTLSSSSPSYPSSPAFCISPRLKKAREDFNAFLAAAQTA